MDTRSHQPSPSDREGKLVQAPVPAPVVGDVASTSSKSQGFVSRQRSAWRLPLTDAEALSASENALLKVRRKAAGRRITVGEDQVYDNADHHVAGTWGDAACRMQ